MVRTMNGGTNLLAEDLEYQGFGIVEDSDERALARRAYRKKVIRGLLAKGNTPTRTNAFLLDMARIVQDAVGLAFESWGTIIEDAQRTAPPPQKKG